MAATASPTEADVLTALGTLLTGLLPAGMPVFAGQANRVSEPDAPDFVVMTPMLRNRLATNRVTTSDGARLTPPAPGTRTALMPTQITIQLDVHGPAGSDNAQVIATLLRDDYACAALAAAIPPIAPLYATDPRQMPFINAEAQYEDRWVIEAVLQANIAVTTPQDFAAELHVGLVEVDEKYPPA